MLTHREQLSLRVVRGGCGVRLRLEHSVRRSVDVEVQPVAEEVLVIRRIDARRHEMPERFVPLDVRGVTHSRCRIHVHDSR